MNPSTDPEAMHCMKDIAGEFFQPVLSYQRVF